MDAGKEYSTVMMMIMMRRFVKRVLNSPQRRCQSIKQVALEMSGERQRRERCGSKGSWRRIIDGSESIDHLLS